jgi:murein L,D-transpeptidase YafK
MNNSTNVRNKLKKSRLFSLINLGTLKNILFFGGGIVIFVVGVIVYGILLNLREISLAEAMEEKGFSALNNVNILVERKAFVLKLFEDTVIIKEYRASFGRNVNTPKQQRSDNSTPIGEYEICKIDTSHKYYKFFKLNYPNLKDASEALRKGIINQKEFDQLKFEFYYDDCPKLKTILGSDVGIHGIGRLNFLLKNLPFVYNWTDGSIALSNESIDELLSVVKKGTKVVIK